MNVLQAVNRILPYLSEGVTTTVHDSNPVTAAVVAALDTERTLVLQQGYWFNQRSQVLALSPGGKVAVPAFCLAGYCPDVSAIVEVRDGLLLNLTDNTDVFQQAVRYDYTEDLTFEQLPAAAAEVVLWGAALTVYIPDFEVDRTAQALQQYQARAQGTLTREHMRHTRMHTLAQRGARTILNALRG